MMMMTSDTDVVVIAVGVSRRLFCELFIKTGVKEKTRILSISRIVQQMKSKHDLERTPESTDAIIGFHAFTGCDPISAFWRKRKRRSWNLMKNPPSSIFLVNLEETGN